MERGGGGGHCRERRSDGKEGGKRSHHGKLGVVIKHVHSTIHGNNRDRI